MFEFTFYRKSCDRQTIYADQVAVQDGFVIFVQGQKVVAIYADIESVILTGEINDANLPTKN